jgi:hypothetical protein
VVKALCYKPEGSRPDEVNFSIYQILPAALDPGVYSASNRNEYQKLLTPWSESASELYRPSDRSTRNRKLIMFQGIKVWSVRRADNLSAICEPIV